MNNKLTYIGGLEKHDLILIKARNLPVPIQNHSYTLKEARYGTKKYHSIPGFTYEVEETDIIFYKFEELGDAMYPHYMFAEEPEFELVDEISEKYHKLEKV